MEQNPAIIIDNGSFFCTIGLSNDQKPWSIFPAIIGKPKNPKTLMLQEEISRIVGDQAQEKRGILDLSFPQENGIVKDWEGMESIWYHAFFNELRYDPTESPLFITETPLNPRKNREMMASYLFEKFDVPSLYISDTALPQLYASGKQSGLVVDCGEGVTSAVPIIDGAVINHAIQRNNVAGGICTDWFSKIIRELGYQFSSPAEREIVRKIKEVVCYVALDFKTEIAKYENKSNENTKSYELPDGRIINIGNQRFRGPEILFNPNLIMNVPGVQEVAYNSLMKLDKDSREKVQQNIYIAGRSTLFDGFPERFEKELKNLATSKMNIQVFAPRNRVNSTFLGATLITSLSTFKSMWITDAQYKENGPSILNRQYSYIISQSK